MLLDQRRWHEYSCLLWVTKSRPYGFPIYQLLAEDYPATELSWLTTLSLFALHGGEATQWQLYYFVPLQLSTLVQKSLTSCQVSSHILFITTLWEFVSLQITLTFHSSLSLCPVKAGLVTVPNKHEQSGRSSGLRYEWHLPATLEFLNFAPPALEEQLLGAPPPAHLAGFTAIYFDLG